MLTCTLVTEGNLLGTTSRKFQSCTSVLHLSRVPLSSTTKHSPQIKTTQFGVLVCQNTILLLKAVQKISQKLKIKNQNIKFRWWNSWPAADFSNTTAPIVVSNPTIIQKSKNSLTCGKWFKQSQQYLPKETLKSIIKITNHKKYHSLYWKNKN